MGKQAAGPGLLTNPKWNFHKFLIDKAGKVADFFIPTTEPDDSKISRKIEQLLNS
jgi:glutathione peroxidase